MARDSDERFASASALISRTWLALDRLAKDRMATIQELVDEATRYLLKKHRRPVASKEMLRESAHRGILTRTSPAQR